MVKKLFTILLLLSLLTFTLAINEEDIMSSDAEKLQKDLDTYLPLDEEGDFNLSGYKPIKSKAEEKIDKINLWLEENASWLKIIFGMVPSITWLFVINIWLMIALFTTLVLNAEGLFGFLDTLNKKVELGIINPTWANLLGLAIFLMLHFTKAIVSLSKIITDQIIFIWEKALPVGIAAALIAAIIIAVVMVVAAIYFPQLLGALAEHRAKSEEEKSKAKEDNNRLALEKMMKAATQGA